MAFKDILIHLDNTPQCSARLSLAINLARQYKAHLTGIYVISHPHYHSSDENAAQKAAEAGSIFVSDTGQAGIQAKWLCIDWPVTGVNVSEVVKLHAYHKDLIIVGQTDYSSTATDVPADLPERLIRDAGRPVLVVPYAGMFKSVGERVMVAWKPGRESVRALNDAMPFLLDSHHVSIQGVYSPSAGGNFDSGTSICSHLARHGIVAGFARFMAADIPIGDVLLTQAWEDGCDLLVMGAYTHNRRGVLTLGPVAQHILKHMTMPVLMSH